MDPWGIPTDTAAHLDILDPNKTSAAANQVRDNRDMILNQTLVKIVQSIVYIKIKSFCQYHSNCIEEYVENCCEGVLGIGKSPYQRKEE